MSSENQNHSRAELRRDGFLRSWLRGSDGGIMLVVEERTNPPYSKAALKGGRPKSYVHREGFLPIISEMPGFVAYYLVDAGDGVTVSTSVFEHKESEEQSNWQAGEFVAEHLAPLMPNPPQVTAGEVAAYKAG